MASRKVRGRAMPGINDAAKVSAPVISAEIRVPTKANVTMGPRYLRVRGRR